MALEFASCDKQYEKFPQLIRDEVLKLQDWYNRQPHTPSITGEMVHTIVLVMICSSVGFLSLHKMLENMKILCNSRRRTASKIE